MGLQDTVLQPFAENCATHNVEKNVGAKGVKTNHAEVLVQPFELEFRDLSCYKGLGVSRNGAL